MEYHLIIKRNEIMSFVGKWMELENTTFIFFLVLGLELRAYTLSHSTSLEHHVK
jgi:hypothetical protein